MALEGEEKVRKAVTEGKMLLEAELDTKELKKGVLCKLEKKPGGKVSTEDRADWEMDPDTG